MGHITLLNILPASPPDDAEGKPAIHTMISVSGSAITMYVMRVPVVPGLISLTFMPKIAYQNQCHIRREVSLRLQQ